MSKVIGDATVTPVPIADWNQTNPMKADYIKNKPDVDALVARVTALEKQIEELYTKIT